MMEIDRLSADVCRLCAETLDTDCCVPLYSGDKRERIITKQINQLVIDLISPNDGLPQKICLKCSRNVELCYSFVSSIIETQNKLKLLKQMQHDERNDSFIDDCRSYDERVSTNETSPPYAVESTTKRETEQIEQELDTADNFIELLVVHPEEVIEMETNTMLEASEDLGCDNQRTAAVTRRTTQLELPTVCSKASDLNVKTTQREEMDKSVERDNVPAMVMMMMAATTTTTVATNTTTRTMTTTSVSTNYDRVKEEKEEQREKTSTELKQNHDETSVVDEFVIKEEPEDMLYCDNYIAEDDQIVELQEGHVTWIYDGKEAATGECAIMYKCGSCANTYETETSFQSHNCGDIYGAKKNKSVFHCEICERVFKSEFVFKLHYAQHKKSTLCQLCNVCFLGAEDLLNHLNQVHPYAVSADVDDVYEEVIADSEKQCDVCGKITDNLKQHKMYHAIKELEYCKAENKKFLKKWFYCEKCNKKIFSEANFLFHLAKHNGEETVRCRQCDYVAVNIQDYNMHITSHTGGKYFICNDCEKCFFTRSAISDHVLIHMDGTRYMCEICGKRFKTSRSNAQHKLLQHKKYFRCNRCNRGFTHEVKLKSHYNICRVINQEQKESKVFEPVEKFFCNICNSNIKSSSEISILFHKAKHEGKDGVECKFCNLLCKNACMYKNHLLIHTNQRPYACTQCPKSFRTKGCLVQHMLVHGDEYKYTCEYCGKKSKKLTTHVNHVNIHTDTKPYKCPDCDRPFRQLSDMKKHRRTHLKYKTEAVTVTELPPYLAVKTEVEDMIAAESIQQLPLT